MNQEQVEEIEEVPMKLKKVKKALLTEDKTKKSRFEKGSKEAKEFMAQIRSKRKPKSQ